MSDLDEQGATRDARTIIYLREGIARRDKEIEKLRDQVKKCLEIQSMYEKRIIELSNPTKP